MNKRPSRRRIEVNLDELDRIIDRATNVPLSKADGHKLKTALHAMAARLTSKRSTEKTNAVLAGPVDSEPAVEPPGSESAAAGHGRNGAVAFAGAKRVLVPHATLQSGTPCPECGEGKVYRQKELATLIRIVGQAPLQTTVFEMERWRCNACGEVFTADVPESAGPDKYDATAVAMIALLKYGMGMPFKRLERLQSELAMPLPAATQWELMEAAAKPMRPAVDELLRQAAQGGVMHNDDTSMRILQLKREPSDKRTGIFTSGIVSLAGARTIALFFTGPRHAGENLAEVLKRRAHELPAPIQMSDALSRNTPKLEGLKIRLANCLAHGRRQFVEVAENFPPECKYVLETLRAVYHHDDLAREQGLSPEDRLHSHKQHSGPLMEKLHQWLEKQFAEHRTEPNSGLGKAISYLLKHWTKLTLFLSQPGAPLDNNIVERALKKAILNRRNALFYKTLNGARTGDLFMSLIHTCELNGANAFDYLTELQRHSAELTAYPSEWMPWNYRETLARLATSSAA
jgi:transposase